MRVTVAMVGLLCLAQSAFPQSTQNSKPQIEQPVQQIAIAQLQKNAEELPTEFSTLAKSLDYSKWTCEVEAKADTQTMITAYSSQIDKISYMVDTIKAQGKPALPEVADATYAFGLGVPIALILTRTTECTGQSNLSAKFSALSAEFGDAAANSHIVELSIIQQEESWIEKLFNTLKQLEQQQQVPIAPEHPAPSES